MNEKLEEIGSRIRELRELSKISPEEMAGYLKVPLETYCGYESGHLDIPASLLFKIAQRLDVDMSLLLTGQEPKMSIFTVTRKGREWRSRGGSSTGTRASRGGSHIRRQSHS
jgi:transcriptional regulator